MATKRKRARRGAARATGGGVVPDRAAALLTELNKGKDSTPAQLLGSNILAIRIRGVISTQCPPLNRAIGRGGIPLGRLTLLHGKESSGKTTLALHIVAETQQRGGMAIYVDAEHKLDPDYAAVIGVDVNQLVIVQPNHVEQFLALVESTIKVANEYRQQGDPFPVLVVLDSINALPTKAEFEGDWDAQHIAPDAGVWSSKLKKLMPLVAKEDVALLFISQEREKIGVMYGRKERTGGGKAPRFYSSLILEVAQIASVKNQKEEIVGSVVKVNCTKNQIAPPFRKAEFKIIYGTGVDYEDALLGEAVRVGAATKSGAWYVFNGERLGQGAANVAQNLRSNPELKQKLEAAAIDGVVDE